jgi:hypothetical protein
MKIRISNKLADFLAKICVTVMKRDEKAKGKDKMDPKLKSDIGHLYLKIYAKRGKVWKRSSNSDS